MNPHNHILTQNFLAIPKTYFDTVFYPALTKAQQAIISYQETLIIAGKNIRIISYTSTSHHAWMMALAHHPKTTNDPDLIIHALDTSSFGNIIPAPWDDPLFEISAQNFDPEFFGIYITGEESLNFYNPQTKTGYFWVHDGSRMPDWSLGAPFRTILHWFLHAENIHFLHGAVVGNNNQGVLITAKSGSGKSTTSLACLLAGMDFVGDDYVAITTDNTVVAHNLYSSAKVTKPGLQLFPELTEQVWNTNSAETEKAVMFLYPAFSYQIHESLPLTTLLIPRIIGGETTITPANKLEALVAVAPTTLLQLPLAEIGKLKVLKEIIKKLPCYYLNLGSDVKGVSKVIREFLK